MAEVEDVRATVQRVKASPGGVSQGLAAGEQGERVDIALDRQAFRKLAVGPGRIDGLVEPDRVDRGFPGVGRKLDRKSVV